MIRRLMPTENFPGKYESLAKIREFVSKIAQDAGLNEADVYAVELAVDEACSNIIEHAYGKESVGDILCTCEESNGGLKIVLHDHGKPFDPKKIPEPDLSLPIKRLKPGGAGLYLMRKMMDEVTFEFNPVSGNTLTMIKNRKKK
jgi:serine/threonine-protein kinase RsbW